MGFVQSPSCRYLFELIPGLPTATVRVISDAWPLTMTPEKGRRAFDLVCQEFRADLQRYRQSRPWYQNSFIAPRFMAKSVGNDICLCLIKNVNKTNPNSLISTDTCNHHFCLRPADLMKAHALDAGVRFSNSAVSKTVFKPWYLVKMRLSNSTATRLKSAVEERF